MPELPEVETTRRGLIPHVVGKQVTEIVVRQGSLRIAVPAELSNLVNQRIDAIHRRAKYLVYETQTGRMIVHLGMSGSLRMSQVAVPLRKHDHVVFRLDSGMEMRFHDPRRFGLVDWTSEPLGEHALIRDLGPEPLAEAFDAEYLTRAAKGRRIAIKTFIMTNQVVVGVGNIYACEALFLAGIHPKREASRVSKVRIERLAAAIKDRLAAAIESGGTTLRDFVREDGQPGYFKQKLTVYGRENEPCRSCKRTIKRCVIGQRSTFYCPKCQR